jgi:hypothetical protein
VVFQPEIVGGYLYLPEIGAHRTNVHEDRGGARIRLGCLCGRIEWFLVYGHVNFAAGTHDLDWLFDIGSALDWRFSGSSLGVHVIYDALGSGGIHWWEVGPHF